MTSIAEELKSMMYEKYRVHIGSKDLPILADACQGDRKLIPIVGMISLVHIGRGAEQFTDFAKTLTTEDGLAYALGRDVQMLRKPGHLVTAALSTREKPLAVESAQAIYAQAARRKYIEVAKLEFPYYEVGEVVQLTDVVSNLLQHDASLANPGLQLTEMFIKASQRYK